MESVADMRAADLVDLVRKHEYRIKLHDLADSRGVVRVWDKPPKKHRLVWGADFALGRTHGDLDAVSVWDADVRPYRQVAMARGRWGERFDRILFAFAWYMGFERCFLIGEANTGIGILKTLRSVYGWHWQYYNRDPRKVHEPIDQRLGRWKTGKRKDDPLLHDLRRATIDGEYELRCAETIKQMTHLQYGTRRKNLDPEAALDAELDVVLAVGGSPDLAISNMLALHGCRQMAHYESEQEDEFATGSMGEIAGHRILSQERAIEAGNRTGWGLSGRPGTKKPKRRQP